MKNTTQKTATFLRQLALTLIVALLAAAQTSWAQDPEFDYNSESKAYLIKSADDFKKLSGYVNEGHDCEKLTFKLTQPINVESSDGFTPIGTQDHPFKGTFDGGGITLTLYLKDNGNKHCAPFSCVNGATFLNLIVSGKIEATLSGEGSHGGFVGVSSGNTTFENCAFVGSLLGSTANKCGGFVGWANNAITYKDCLFAPTEITMSIEGSATFDCGENESTYTSCYYTQPFGKERGVKVVKTQDTPTNSIYNKNETQKLADGNEYYYASSSVVIEGLNTIYWGDNAKIFTAKYGENALAVGTDYTVEYTDNKGNKSSTITTSGNYTLTITGINDYVGSITHKFDFISGYGTEESPYLITTTVHLDALSALVNGGNDCSGKYFKLGNNIEYNGETENNFTAIGWRDEVNGKDYYFNGTFDGGGHKISGIRISNPNKSYQGLFGQNGENGIVKNVILADANITGTGYVGGIVGYNKGKITDCKVVNAKITGQGAIAGYTSNSNKLENNYYYDCNVKGCNGEDINPNDGAVPALIIDGDSDKIVSVKVGNCYAKAFYLRNITAGIPTTIMLPFQFNAKVFGKEVTFRTFGGVDMEKWEVTMDIAGNQDELSANTPYMFEPTQDMTMVSFENVTVTKDGDQKSATLKGWTFHGTYERIVWSSSTNIYGYAATSKPNNDGVQIAAGDFVRARNNVGIKPTRAYLEYIDNNVSKSAIVLPDRLKVVFSDNATASVIDAPSSDPSDSGDISTPTSELAPAANVKVWSYDKTIYIASRPGVDFRIIDANGRLLKESTTQTDRDEIHLGRANGIVIVIIGGKAYKVNY